MIHKLLYKYLIATLSITSFAYGMEKDLDMQLINATKNGNLDQVKELLKNELVNINCIDTSNIYHHTSLSYACSNGHFKIAQLLVKNRADINYMGPKGHYPLFWASINNYFPVVKLLLSNGAQIHQNANRDPLLTVSFEQYFDIAKLLLDYGANPDIISAEHRTTPLIAASIMNNIQIVQLLLDNNADTSIKSEISLTARDYAFKGGYGRIVAAIDRAEKKRAAQVFVSKRLIDYCSKQQPSAESLLACKREIHHSSY